MQATIDMFDSDFQVSTRNYWPHIQCNTDLAVLQWANMSNHPHQLAALPTMFMSDVKALAKHKHLSQDIDVWHAQHHQ